MRESFGSNFEHRFEEPRIPEEQRFRELARRAAERIRWETQNPLSREIAEKILFKLDLKDRLSEIDRHRDDPLVYQNLKRLGIFLVFDRRAQHEWKDEQSGFLLEPGDRYLDLHLPPVDLQKRKSLLSLLTQARLSLELLAKYIQEQKMNPKYILRVTYEKLASVSRRFGFRLIEPPIPDEVCRGVGNVYHNFVQSGTKGKKDIGRILVCYQGLDEFMDKYSKTK